AQASGEYERAGLDVEFVTPPDAAAPLKLVEAGRVDLAISYEPDVMLARDEGADVVAVGALVQKPLTSLMSLGDKAITDPKQLAGKTVGTAGIPYQSAYLRTILDTAGVNPDSVKEVNVGFKLTQAMLSKKVDATIGAFWNVEGVQLEQAGRKPHILKMEDLGVPTYDELVLAAARDSLNETTGSKVRRFLQATARGYELVKADPSKGVDALLAANPDLDRKLTERSVTATVPVFFPEDSERPFGWQEPAEWAAYEKWMRANDLLKPPVQGERAPLTNEFLPGEGLDQGTSGLE
ncbi:MAG TPA: ABC transporter substrate-binding protein, partial [Solirubrobacteraceae bacterium]|nr:ABC transporter substrate-binding protein [Solirubrobacteraceae bacterium]